MADTAGYDDRTACPGGTVGSRQPNGPVQADGNLNRGVVMHGDVTEGAGHRELTVRADPRAVHVAIVSG